MKKYTNQQLHDLLETEIDQLAHGIDFYYDKIEFGKTVNHNIEHIYVLSSLCAALMPLLEYAEDRWPERKGYFDQVRAIASGKFFQCKKHKSDQGN